MAVTVTVATRCQAMTQKDDQCSREATVYEERVWSPEGGPVRLVEMIEKGRRPSDYRYGLGFPDAEFYCSLHARGGRYGIYGRI